MELMNTLANLSLVSLKSEMLTNSIISLIIFSSIYIGLLLTFIAKEEIISIRKEIIHTQMLLASFIISIASYKYLKFYSIILGIIIFGITYILSKKQRIKNFHQKIFTFSPILIFLPKEIEEQTMLVSAIFCYGIINSTELSARESKKIQANLFSKENLKKVSKNNIKFIGIIVIAIILRIIINNLI